jgi:hypothetical protein
MNQCIKTDRKAKRFMFGCAALIVLLGAAVVSNMTYEDEVSYDEHRAQMEQLWKDSNGEYGWPPITP